MCQVNYSVIGQITGTYYIFKHTENGIAEKSDIHINTVFIEPVFYVCDTELTTVRESEMNSMNCALICSFKIVLQSDINNVLY